MTIFLKIMVTRIKQIFKTGNDFCDDTKGTGKFKSLNVLMYYYKSQFYTVILTIRAKTFVLTSITHLRQYRVPHNRDQCSVIQKLMALESTSDHIEASVMLDITSLFLGRALVLFD